MKNNVFENSTVDDKEKSATTKINGINVKIHIPNSVSENIKKQKINRLYDILKPIEKASSSTAA